MIKCIIVDDEQKNRETLHTMINTFCQGLEVTDLVSDIQSAKSIIESTKPQLVFLDIEMPPHTAFDLLRSLEYVKFEIIFVTAFSHYAIDAIKYSALDYILKPINIDELKKGVDRAKKKIESKVHNYAEQLDVLLQNPNQLKRIIVNSTNETKVIEIDEIIHIQAENTYSSIFLINYSRILSPKPIFEYEKMLSPIGFFRVHKSHIVNINQIDKVQKGDNAGIKMKNGTIVPLASRKKESFMNYMKENLK